MKFIVVGLGSMGKRRIRLLRNHFKGIDICGVDTREDRRKEVSTLFGIETKATLNEIIEKEKPDAVLICTSPASHDAIAQECLKYKLNIFSEINLINENHEAFIKKTKENNTLYFLSSTLLYRNEITYIIEKISNLKGYTHCHYRYHVGQYLPNWHPWESHEDFFVADKMTNGCREIFAIEIPWIVKAFGRIKSITSKADCISDLKLSYPDSYIVIIEHESGHIGTINVDVVSRKAVRSLEVYGADVYLTWDGKPEGLYDYSTDSNDLEQICLYDKTDKDVNYAENIIENAYLEELTAFISLIKGNEGLRQYSLEEEAKVLSQIDKIEGKF